MVKTVDNIKLVADARSGCQSALNELADKVCRRAYPVLLKMTRDEDLSHDLLQETLLAMLRSLENLERIEGFWGWIHTIARNKVYDHFRKRHRREISGLLDFDDLYDCQDTGMNDSTLKHVIDIEMKEYLAEAIGNLRKRHQEVVRLRHFENRPYTEIASLSDCTPQQARVRFFRAKQSLRNRLSAADFEL
jgi:RNA polymerase sigma-70 factor (ECF subfamily)